MNSSKIDQFLLSYKSEYGEMKLRGLISDVNSGKRFNRFIEDCKHQNFLPNPNTFLACVMNSIFYSFAGKVKIVATTLLLFQRWIREVDPENVITDEDYLDHFAQLIINEGNKLGI